MWNRYNQACILNHEYPAKAWSAPSPFKTTLLTLMVYFARQAPQRRTGCVRDRRVVFRDKFSSCTFLISVRHLRSDDSLIAPDVAGRNDAFRGLIKIHIGHTDGELRHRARPSPLRPPQEQSPIDAPTWMADNGSVCLRRTSTAQQNVGMSSSISLFGCFGILFIPLIREVAVPVASYNDVGWLRDPDGTRFQ